MTGKTRLESDYHQPSELILRDDGSVYHLGLKSSDIADKVIIVGDPDRVEVISSKFDQVEKKIRNREFVTHTGIFRGKRLTVISTGIGVDNIDIVVNELDAAINIDPDTRKLNKEIRLLEMVRIGTCGSLHEDIPVGSFVLSAYAYGWDGMPFYYELSMNDDEKELAIELESKLKPFKEAGKVYVAKASDRLAERIGKNLTRGITATANGFYGAQDRMLRLQKVSSFSEQLKAFQYKGLRVTNFEMETSGIYALGSGLGHQAVTVSVVLANRARKEFHNDPSESIEKLIDLVLERF